jgi:hypothetical protein
VIAFGTGESAVIRSLMMLGLALLPPAAAGDPSPVAPKDPSLVHVVIDTIGVDGHGTRVVDTDDADLAPGTAGVLEKSVSLVGRADTRQKETVRIRARITPSADRPDGAACVLQIDLQAQRVVSKAAAGGKAPAPESRSSTITLAPGQDRLVEAYASPLTDGRVAFKVRCEPTVGASSSGAEAQLVSLHLEVERSAAGEATELLRNQLLTASLGHEASIVVTAHMTLPDGEQGEKRFRQESLEIVLSPIVVTGGKVQIAFSLKAEVATVTSGRETISHPIEHDDTFLVSPGEPRRIDLALPGAASEGWADLHFRVEISSRF